MELQFECITIEKDEGTSAILGHAGFIKTVEDLYEAMAGSVPGIECRVGRQAAKSPLLERRATIGRFPHRARSSDAS